MTAGIERTATTSQRRLNIAMIGTRGVPAAYGGFETAVEEIGRRLVARGHDVTVYCRHTAGPVPKEYLGMTLVDLPALRHKILETLSHTLLSVLHASVHRRPDVAFIFNSANAPFVPVLRLRGIPSVVHVDGLEWKRDKWGGAGRRYYRWAEGVAVREADALIADAQGIVDYYQDEFEVPTELISYGTRILRDTPTDRLAELGLRPGGYHLVVARFEPENHVDVIVEGYRASGARLPLVVVGSAPYAVDHVNRIADLAASDSRIRMLGSVWDQDQLDQLYAHASTYLHGHSVGGTNPSLLRAMGAGTKVIAWDVVFNREVLGADGAYFNRTESIAALIEDSEVNPDRISEVGAALQERAAKLYNWDSVTASYEGLARRVVGGYSTHRQSSGRASASTWNLPDTTSRQPSTTPSRGITL
jgi:glycosyltransferase involved in cell wall biosynthesis